MPNWPLPTQLCSPIAGKSRWHFYTAGRHRTLSSAAFHMPCRARLTPCGASLPARVQSRCELGTTESLIWRRKNAEFESCRVQSAALQHAHALGQRIADGFDSDQRQGRRSIDLQRDALAGESDAFLQGQPVGRASNGSVRIPCNCSGHFRQIVSEASGPGWNMSRWTANNLTTPHRAASDSSAPVPCTHPDRGPGRSACRRNRNYGWGCRPCRG